MNTLPEKPQHKTKGFMKKYLKILLLSTLAILPLVVVTAMTFFTYSGNAFLGVMLFLWPVLASLPLITTIKMVIKLYDSKKEMILVTLLMPTIYILPYVLVFVYQFFFSEWSFRIPF